jgi:hypothetical protein
MPFVITQGELAYEAGLVLTGAWKVFCATKGSLTLASSLAAWEAAELPPLNGYAAVTGTLGTPAFNAVTGRYEAPIISGQFVSSDAGYEFNAMVVKLAGRTAPYAVNLYDVPIVLSAGQAQGFNFTLAIKP